MPSRSSHGLNGIVYDNLLKEHKQEAQITEQLTEAHTLSSSAKASMILVTEHGARISVRD